jgi:methionyl-tRNA synthetase
MVEGIATINFEDFEKLDLRVATIKEAEDIEGADKLYKLTLDDGTEEVRTICAGIKESYTKEDLKGKQIIIIANLAPRKMRGVESQGMLLAASSDDHGKVSLITPDQDMMPGSSVG